MYACGFRIYFTPLPGFFSPFLHSTCSLSVDYEYLALEDGPPIFRQDYTCPALLVVRSVPPIRFRVRGYHPLWPAFPYRSTSQSTITHRLLRFRSPLLSESRLFSLPPPTEMFQFGGFPPHGYGFTLRYRRITPVGFPIRTSTDQSLFASSPRLFAGYNVLHRL